MLRKVLGFLSSLQLTFWLLLSVTACLVIGSRYAQVNREFYKALDSTTVQEWFLHSGSADPARSWWVLVLFLAMGLLGINTVLCALNRIVTLWRNGSGIPPGRRFLLFVPSFVHILFVLTLSGHLLTFTLGVHQRVPVDEETMITLPSGTRLKVESVETREYPTRTRLQGRLQGASILLRNLPGGTRRELRFMQPIMIGPDYLHLDFEPNPTGGAGPSQSPAGKPVRMFVRVTRDPGLPVIVTGLILQIGLMLVYYLARLRIGPLGPRSESSMSLEPKSQ